MMLMQVAYDAAPECDNAPHGWWMRLLLDGHLTWITYKYCCSLCGCLTLKFHWWMILVRWVWGSCWWRLWWMLKQQISQHESLHWVLLGFEYGSCCFWSTAASSCMRCASWMGGWIMCACLLPACSRARGTVLYRFRSGSSVQSFNSRLSGYLTLRVLFKRLLRHLFE